MQRCINWINKLSLDAPTVGLLWMLLFIREYQIHFSLSLAILLFSSIWIVYTLDRVFEQQPSRMRDRHVFYQKHKSLFITLAAVACAGNGVLLFVSKLQMEAALFGAIMALLALLYLLLAGKISATATNERIKNIFVSLVFTLGVSFPVWATELKIIGQLPVLKWELMSLGLLIYSNLRFIESSEQTLELNRIEKFGPGLVMLLLLVIIPSKLNLIWSISYLGMLMRSMKRNSKNSPPYDLTLILVSGIALCI